MGNNSHTAQLPSIEWEKVDTDNGIEIYKNKANNQLAEKRIITLNQEYDYSQELEIYNIRQQNNEALVRILGIQHLYESIKPNIICSGQKKIFVYTEKITYRLSECPQLTFPQSLLFMKQALRAFQRIYRDYGPVQVTKQMIGINYLGQIRSWLNQNWALNHRDHQYSNLGSQKLQDLTRSQYLSYRSEYMTEQQMVWNIISVIQQKCQEGRFPQAFRQELQHQSTSFRKLLLYLKDFIEFNDILVPEKIVYDLLVQNDYIKRLELQMGNNNQLLQMKNEVMKGDNRQYLQSNFNHLNSDLTKYMHQNTQQNLFITSPCKRLKSSQLNNSQVNQPKYQTNYHSIQPSSQPFKYPIPHTPLSNQPQNYSFSTHNYQSQPINLTQSPYNNSLSTHNYLPQPTNQYLVQPNQYYNHHLSFNNSAPLKYPNSSHLPNDATQTRNYHLIPSTGLGPSTNAPIFPQPILPSVRQQTQTTNAQPSGQNAILKMGHLTYQDLKTITDKPIQMDVLSKYKLLEQITPKPITAQNSSQSYPQNTPTYGYSNIYPNNSSQPITTKQTFTPLNSINESHQLSNPSHYSQAHSSQSYSTFSFGSILEQNSLLSNPYAGTGYSNPLVKYEPSNSLSKNVGLEGKYVEEFKSLLSPSLQHNITIQNNHPSNNESKNVQTAVGRGIVDTNAQQQEKSYDEVRDENFSIGKQGIEVDKAIFKDLNSFVERNEVSESILRPF